MLTREDLEAFRARHVQARDKLIANVNVCQGAIDSANALLKLWDQREAEVDALASADRKPEFPAKFPIEPREFDNGRS